MLEKLIVRDTNLRSTTVSYFLVLVFYVNLNLTHSIIIGVSSFILYFLINGTFLAHVFFENETTLIRLTLGTLSLTMLLGLASWLIMIIHNLNTELFSIALLVTATVSTLLNRKMKRQKNAAN